MKKTMISLKEKLGFMTFSTSSNIVFNFKNIYYLIFLTNVLKVPVLTAGTILTLGTIWDAVNDPLIGIFSANHTFRNGEKVRPYALWCAVPWAVTIVLMFSDFKTGQTLTVILCLVIYFIFEALYTFLAMPYNSMGSLASNIDSDRKSINAFRSLGGCLGSGIGSVAVTPLVKLFGGLQGEGAIIGSGDAPALLKTAILMGVICIIGCLTHYFTTKERVKQSSDDESRISLFQAYRMLFKCRSWVLNMFYIICYGIITVLIMNNINYYAAYIMGSSAKATPILAVYLVVAILTSIFTPMVDSRIGRKNTMILGAVLQLVGKIPFIINPYSVASIYINALSVGLGSTITFVMFNTNRNNIADIVEWKNGRRIDSMVAAGDNLASKLAEAGAVQLMAFALSRAGFDEALKMNQTSATLQTICALLGWAPLIVSIIMLIVLIRMDIQKEMEECRPVTE
ncbi:MAG: MFS transporter [Oscillospiraceae bacterium]|nr:MFS transporter [Oscillospiraceae bacterium]